MEQEKQAGSVASEMHSHSNVELDSEFSLNEPKSQIIRISSYNKKFSKTGMMNTQHNIAKEREEGSPDRYSISQIME